MEYGCTGSSRCAHEVGPLVQGKSCRLHRHYDNARARYILPMRAVLCTSCQSRWQDVPPCPVVVGDRCRLFSLPPGYF